MQYYPPVGEAPGKREQVAEMFDAIAPRYDLLNRVLSLGTDRRWRVAAVRALGVRPSERILDVATGTGDLAFEVLRRCPAMVVGVDISEEMLSVARAKAVRKGASEHVSFVRADAEDMPFEDGVFDAALVAFGVRNFQELRRGLGEIRRVLRPGARVVVLEFSQPQSRLFGMIYGLYSRLVLPYVGRMLSQVHGAYSYLPDSIRAFPHGAAFLAQMRAAGFEDLHAKPITFGVASIYSGRAPMGRE